MKRTKTKFVYIMGSAIIGIVAIICVLLGLFLSGAIDARSKKVVFETPSKEMVYDGTQLVDDAWKISDGELKKDHYAEVVVTGALTNVGECDNTLSVVIKDKNGADVSSDYDIEYKIGKLKVLPRPITLTSGSATKEYDGTPLEADVCTPGVGELLEGHVLDASVTGAQTDVATVANTFTARILNADGEDVTFNYAVTNVQGQLTVTKRPITVATGDAQKIYDGTPLAGNPDDCVVSSTKGLLNGHVMTVALGGTLTNAGSKYNEIASVTVMDGEKDVSGNYEVTPMLGTLTVEKRRIAVRSASESREYNGEPLSNTLVEQIDGVLADNQTLDAHAVDSITYVGKIENRITAVIRNAANEEVQSNYEIEYVFGDLEIKPCKITIETGSDSKTYDGTPLKKDAVSVKFGQIAANDKLLAVANSEIVNAESIENDVALDIVSKSTGESLIDNYDVTYRKGTLTIYPRPILVGSESLTRPYDGTELKGDPAKCGTLAGTELLQGHSMVCALQGSQTTVGSSPNLISGVTITNGSEDVTKNYAISVQPGVLKVDYRKITLQTGTGQKPYDGTPLEVDTVEIISGSLADNQSRTSHTITSIDSVNTAIVYNEAVTTIEDANGMDVTSNYEITYQKGTLQINPLTIAVSAGSYVETYTGNPVKGDPSDCSVVSQQQLLAGHTIDYYLSGSLTDVGMVVNAIEAVFIKDASGADVTKNYRYTAHAGTIEITPVAITFNTGSDSKTYDGKPLSKYGVNIVSGELVGTDTYTFEMSESYIVDVGSIENKAEIIVSSASGKDVSKNYAITCVPGVLTVTKKSVTFATESAEKTYDGTALTKEGVSIVGGSLVDGHTRTYNMTANLVNAGSAQNTAIVTIMSGTMDVTGNYDIAYEPGTLVVKKREIAFETGSASKVYDGTPLTKSGVSKTSGSLVSGHAWSYVMTGSVTDAKTVDNGAEVTIMSGSENVTGNYAITVSPGKLKVDKRPITIETGSDSKTYDGQELSKGEATCVEGTIVSGQSLFAKAITKITTVQTVKNDAEVSVLTSSGVNVTENYAITYRYGTLSVTKRPITIATGSDSKTYDGKALTVEAASLIYGSIAAGEDLDVQAIGSIVNVGSVDNEMVVSIVRGGNDVTSNYEITRQPGKLAINPIALTIESASDAKEYDGTALIGNEADCSIIAGELLARHDIFYTTLASITNVGKTTNTIDTILIVCGEEDVTGNYTFERKEGVLTITPRTITIKTEGASKTYDGTPLTMPTATHTGGELVGAHRVEAFSAVSLTKPGTKINEATVRIYDGDQDVTGNYLVEEDYGQLQVLARSIVFRTGDNDKTYDGTQLTMDSIEIVSGELVSGDYYEEEVYGALTNAGTAENNANVLIYSLAGDNVTDCYDIKVNAGTLKVYQLPITIKTEDDSKTYDGLPLTKGGMTVSQGTLLSGHTLGGSVTGILTNVGSTANLATPEIYDGQQRVTDNYLISYEWGTLTVTPIRLKFVSEGDSKTYDGLPLSNSTVSLVSGSVAAGDDLTFEVSASITNAGSIKNSITVAITRNGRNVLSNYEIVKEEGTLTVNPILLTVTSKSYEQTYNGLPLTGNNADCTIEEGELLSGHTIEFAVRGTQTSVGQSINELASIVVKCGEEIVTQNYTFVKKEGKLLVTKIPLKVKTYSDSKTYDGTELTLPLADHVSGDLLAGHTLNAQAVGSIVDVGVVENVARVAVMNGDEDVTKYYDISYETGKLTVWAKEITVVSGSYEKVYDDVVLQGKLEDCGLADGSELVGTQTISYTLSGAQREVGESTNYLASVVIKDGERIVTDNYKIRKLEGTLKVKPRAISVRSDSATKIYDGTPLACDGYSIVSVNQLVSGHDLDLIMPITRTEVGRSQNTITDAHVTTADGRIVTHNYEISLFHGDLIVTGDPSQSGAQAGGESSGDLSGKMSEETMETVVAQIYATVAKSLYLRSQSFGNYTGKGFSEAEEYTDYLEEPYGMTYLTGLTLGAKSYNKEEARIEIFDGSVGYLLPYYLSMETYYYDVQANETYNQGNVSSEYAARFYDYDYTSGLSATDLGSYSTAEKLYRAFVKENYLSLDGASQNTIDYLEEVITTKGWSAATADIVAKVASYIQNAATYNLDYPDALDEADDVVYAFLAETKEGVCRHYAAAATLMYRYLGIPARYTVGYNVTTTAGGYTEIKGGMAHAWVEVYLDGIGWVCVEVTGGGNSGSDDDGVSTTEYVVKAPSVYQLYNGETLVAPESVSYSEKLQTLIDVKKYTAVFKVSGSQTGVGIGESKIDEFILYDEDGNDVTYKYNIVKKPGVLHVYLYEASVETLGAEKTYDGTELTNTQSVVTGLQDGHSAQVVTSGTQTAVGESANYCSVVIKDEAGNDVSHYYKINFTYGRLIVNARAIVVESGSASKVYDAANPTPLTCEEFQLVNSSTVDGHNIQANFTGKQIRKGESSNLFTITITDENGKDVTRNYAIKYVYGKLEVLAA